MALKLKRHKREKHKLAIEQKYLNQYDFSHVHQQSANPNAQRVAGKILSQWELLHIQSNTA